MIQQNECTAKGKSRSYKRSYRVPLRELRQAEVGVSEENFYLIDVTLSMKVETITFGKQSISIRCTWMSTREH